MKHEFRVREIRMFNGNVMFIPEMFDRSSHPFPDWVVVGDKHYYASMEEAMQPIDAYKREHQDSYTEIVHAVY